MGRRQGPYNSGVSRRDLPFAALIVITAIVYVTIPAPPVHSASAFWSESLVARANTLIFASSHFGQVLDHLTLQIARALFGPSFAVVRAMSLVTDGMGLVYLGALAVFASTLERDRRIPLFILGAVSPVNVFLHGDAALGAFAAPFALLAVALYRSWDDRIRSERAAIPAIVAGLGAALHGAGLIFLPGVLALQIAADRARSWGAVARSAIAAGAAFFGPNGALLVFYVLAFKNVTIIPGDANGGTAGGQIQEFIFPFQSIPAQGAFRAYAFFSWLHLVDVVTALAMGVPALAAVLAFALLRRRDVGFAIRQHAPEWILGAMGVVLVIILYPGVGIIADQYFLVPELAVLQVLSLGLVLELGRAPWRGVFWPLLAITLGATIVDWQLYWQGAL